MTDIVKGQIIEISYQILALSRAGKYGAAIHMLQQTNYRSDEDIKRLMRETIEEDRARTQAIDGCCGCCGELCSTNCGYLYCVGTCGVIACCGPDTASALCGIDWMRDCFTSQCCGR